MPEFIDGLFRVTLVALHSMLWLRDATSWLFAWVWTGIAHSIKHKGTKQEYIAADKKALRKVPQHLAIVVQEEHISSDDLARIAMWAFASDVLLVSLYDPYGNIMKEMSSLQKSVRHHHQQLFSPPLPDVNVCTSGEAMSPTQLHRNCPYQVVVLSQDNGRHSVVETAVGLCHLALEGGVRVEQVDTDMVNNRIANSLGLPDPELAMVFGSACSMVGYPPWQLRLTEIHTIPTHHKMSYQQFLQVLHKYSSCQQRCGK